MIRIWLLPNHFWPNFSPLMKRFFHILTINGSKRSFSKECSPIFQTFSRFWPGKLTSLLALCLECYQWPVILYIRDVVGGPVPGRTLQVGLETPTRYHFIAFLWKIFFRIMPTGGFGNPINFLKNRFFCIFTLQFSKFSWFWKKFGIFCRHQNANILLRYLDVCEYISKSVFQKFRWEWKQLLKR